MIDGRAGGDMLDGAGGNDTASFSGLSAPVDADLAGGTATGQGSDTLAGFENLIGSDQADTLTGDGADNVIDGRAGGDTLDGAGGNDTASFSGLSAPVDADLAGGTATGQGSDSLAGFENLIGSDQADTLAGDGADNVIDGRAGSDGMTGAGGTDTASFAGLSTAVTADLAAGTATGQGTDTLATFENLTGSPAGGDRLVGDGSSNVLDGTGGAGDTADFSAVSQAVTATLATVPGTATGQGTDTLKNIQSLIGSDQNDSLTGDANANLIEGRQGSDTMAGGAGTDVASFAGVNAPVTANLAAGAASGQGTDTITGFEGLIGSPADGDLLVGDANPNGIDGGGGAGDTAGFFGVNQGVIVNLSPGGSGTSTGQGNDFLQGIANVTGSNQGDIIAGNTDPNVLAGLGGGDQLTGRAGVDTFIPGPGQDLLDAKDGTSDQIECDGLGPDSGSVDTSPAETYLDACNTDGDALVDFLDACPTQAAATASGCPASAPPGSGGGQGSTGQTPVTPKKHKKKCKKHKHKHKHRAAAAKKCKKKKKKK